MGGKTSTSASNVQIPASVLAQYNSVNQSAEQAAATPFQTYGGQFVEPVNSEQLQGIAGTNEAANEAQPYYEAATGTLSATQAATNPVNTAAEYGTAASASPLSGSQIDQYLSPYLGTVLGSTEALQNQENQQAQAGQLGDAITSGAFGSDRTGIAAANLQQQEDLANSNVISGIANTGYQSALSTAQGQQQIGLAGAQQLAGIGSTAYGEGANTASELGSLGTGAETAGLTGAQAELGAGTVEQQTQQAQDTALYNQFEQQQSYPFQVDQFLAGIAEGTGSLSGSSTTTTQPGGFFSDRRLKRDIKKIGKTYDGQDVVTYKMGDDNRTRIGLIAQDVEKKHPDAVGLAGGFKVVDYGKATRKAANQGHFAEGGVVAFRRHRDAGGAIGGGLAGVLQAQAAMYGQMGGGGQGGAGMSRVPAATAGGGHGLAVAQTQSSKPQSGVSDVKDLASLAKTGQQFYDKYSSPSNGGINTDMSTNGTDATIQGFNDAQPSTDDMLDSAMAADGGLGADSADGGMNRGGGVVPFRRRRDAGGPTPYDDQGALDIPDDQDSTATLQPAKPKDGTSSTNQDLNDIAGIAGIVGALKRGGVVRPHRDTGGGLGGGLDIPDQQQNIQPLQAAPAGDPAKEENDADMQDIKDVAEIAGVIAMLKRGGAVGRHGFDGGGAAEDDSADDDADATDQSGAAAPATDPDASTPSSGGLKGFWERNKGDILPVLSGIAAMGTAKTVHPGVALAAGLGAGADAYLNDQTALAKQAQTQAQTQGLDIQNQIQAMRAKAAANYLNPNGVPRAPAAGSPGAAQGAPAPTAAEAAVSTPPAAGTPSATSYGLATGTSPTTGAAAPSAAQIPSNPAAATAASIDQAYRQKYFVQPGYLPNEQAAMQNAIKASMVLGDAPVNAVKQQHDNRVQTAQASNRNAAQAEADSLYAQATDPNADYATAQAALAKYNAVHQWTGDDYTTVGGNKNNSRTGAPAIGIAAPQLTPDQLTGLIGQANGLVSVPNSDGTITQMPAWQAHHAPSAAAYARQMAIFATSPNDASPSRTAAPNAPAPVVPAPRGVAAPVRSALAPATAAGQPTSAQASDPYLAKALADPTWRAPKPPVVSGTTQAPQALNLQNQITDAGVQLSKDADSVTNTSAMSLQYLQAAQAIMKSKGAPVTGMFGPVAATVSKVYGGVNSTNYQEVAKYLSNAAAQTAKASFPNATQQEMGMQFNEMSPNVSMNDDTINDLLATNIRAAKYTLGSASRAKPYLDAGNNPLNFEKWNQTFYPREKLVNATRSATNPKTGQRAYLVNGQWTQ